MRLADRIAQCRTPFIVEDTKNKRQTRLIGAADFADTITACPVRYCLSDDLVALCCALAYSKGTRTLECADLLHVPAERVWIEWCEAPWINELARYGFRTGAGAEKIAGRRGALVQTSPQGRQGLIKTFWTCGETDFDVLASSMEAYFDFDAAEGQDPMAPDGHNRPAISVLDHAVRSADILRRCFRFRYERSWDDYYARAQVPLDEKNSIARHALGTIAIDIPVLLVFFLLLATRPGLPRRPLILERLNQARIKSGKAPLLEHIEVSSPLLPEYRPSNSLRVFRPSSPHAQAASCPGTLGETGESIVLARTPSKRKHPIWGHSFPHRDMDPRLIRRAAYNCKSFLGRARPHVWRRSPPGFEHGLVASLRKVPFNDRSPDRQEFIP